MRAKRKSKGEESYSSGAFGLDSKPETTAKQGKKVESRKDIEALPSTSREEHVEITVAESTSREEHVEITFAEPVFEFVAPSKEQHIHVEK